MTDPNAEIFARAQEAVDKLLDELQRTATVNEQLHSTRSELARATAALTSTGHATTQLVTRLEALAAEIQKLDPGIIANQLTDFRAKIDHLTGLVKTLADATTQVDSRAHQLLAEFQRTAEGLQTEVRRVEENLAPQVSALSELLKERVLGAVNEIRSAQDRLEKRLRLLGFGVMLGVAASLGALVLLAK